ncbi:hypothetical protein [Rathayibacter toxicus]|uniref:Condensation domain-containing protein n=1 Tax=Rathayibacter toxicus TaxID=145458 RepID=A0A0C5BER9_9MICO|nr:hypothetical protein [Rathayibacter toxicus]AJM77816.1 hypothetical protein TI83_07380 [Rathayibacter toxicus]ALS58001.1 hypothetical protein APU90_09695 [Rathayibacter toxicus]KKM44289.1 hypothetical protein VT73_10325 [Rathayibacter toxicus]PPG20313.1 hypothetical protein C5D15_07210 [Rathayibacter toxicus]PPG45414.1 hypothetical protein C5D16_07175 [Rathayibacter toxicus]
MTTTPAWGIQRELIMRASAGTGELATHEFPAAWEVRAIIGDLDLSSLVAEVDRVLGALEILHGDLVRTESDAEIRWAGMLRRLYDIRVVKGYDITALADAVHRPFRLDAGDRARAVLTHGPKQAHLLIAIDHAYGDGQTLALVFDAILSGYTARRVGAPTPGLNWTSFRELTEKDFQPQDEADDRQRYFDRMRTVARRTAEIRYEHPVGGLRATTHQRVVLDGATSKAIRTNAASAQLPLGELITAGMLAIQPTELDLPVAFARHGRRSALWFRAPGSAYENLFSAPVRHQPGNGLDPFAVELSAVPTLDGLWATDFLSDDETYELRRYASSTFPMTRPQRIPGATVVADDRLFLELFEYTDMQEAQERRYEVFIMAWTRDDGRLFFNAHVDSHCVPDPADYLARLVTAISTS